MRGLQGKNVIVTGGASGIGQATAARFLEEGCAVCVFDRSADARARVAEELPDLSAVIAVDVAHYDEVQAAFKEALSAMGSVDILINNAGISIRHDFLDITPDEWDSVVNVNLKGIFYMAQTAARLMVERGSGVIINTASTAANKGYPHYADYSASKGGVLALTMAMALELAPTVRVNAISPGYVLTQCNVPNTATKCWRPSMRKFLWAGIASRKKSHHFSLTSRPRMRHLRPAMSTSWTAPKQQAACVVNGVTTNEI